MSPTITAPIPPILLTAEEYAALPDDGRTTELVRGRIVEMLPTDFRHAVVCNRVSRLLGDCVEDRKLGWVMSNDAAVITRRGPDTVRWPDIAFFSYKRVPKDQSPKGCPHVPPELILEVRSSLGSWATILTKVGEYLIAEVLVVCVVDLVTESIWVQPEQSGPRQLTANDDLTLPEVFPDFCVPVRQFFE